MHPVPPQIALNPPLNRQERVNSLGGKEGRQPWRPKNVWFEIKRAGNERYEYVVVRIREQGGRRRSVYVGRYERHDNRVLDEGAALRGTGKHRRRSKRRRAPRAARGRA